MPVEEPGAALHALTARGGLVLWESGQRRSGIERNSKELARQVLPCSNLFPERLQRFGPAQ